MTTSIATVTELTPSFSQQTAEFVQQHWARQPQCAVVLGTGLGGFVEALDVECLLRYEELPHFPQSTALGHQGQLVCGMLDEIPMIALQGRCHCYEGASLAEITFAVDVLQALEVPTLVVSCAAGGLSTDFSPGELMLINDHIDFLFQHRSLTTTPRIRQGSQPELYDAAHNRTLRELARRLNIPLRSGTYIAVQGPNYETRAELRFFKRIADAIGMSTVPEVVRAQQHGLRVCGIATITNICNPDQNVHADGHEVVQVATQAEPNFRKLISEFVRTLA